MPRASSTKPLWVSCMTNSVRNSIATHTAWWAMSIKRRTSSARPSCVFCRAIQGGGGPTRYLRAYLYRVLHNLVVDRHRRKDPVLSELVPEQIPAGESANPAVSVHAALEQQEARALLWRLTDEQRQVILLKYFQELPNGEIAEILAKTEGAVKALQHRGLASLRRLIKDQAAARE